MVKVHEYLGNKATSWEPYGYRKEIAVYVKRKDSGEFLVERHNEYFDRTTQAWKTLEELKQAIRKLDAITEKGLAYLGLDIEHCPRGFRKSDRNDQCVRESADELYEFRR